MKAEDPLYLPLELPCGVVLKNRIAKAAMSDSLGDGRGDPTDAQLQVYGRWAAGGLGLAIIGEVQGNPSVAEKPGNLVLGEGANSQQFQALAQAGQKEGAQLWLQLGHAGAMAFPPTSDPVGPSALDIPGVTCRELSLEEIEALPGQFAETAGRAKALGFGGVEIHAAHGFLLSQFLSPLFNHRKDGYGGGMAGRMRLLLETVDAVRKAVGPGFPVAVKLNATDQLEGGLTVDDALSVAAALDKTSIDLLDISGGTYFPGAKAASDGAAKGPYFLDFARRARRRTRKPLMITGGFKRKEEALSAISEGVADVIGLARALVLDPELPQHWQSGQSSDPQFPRFASRPEGGVTAWYSLRIGQIAQGDDALGDLDLDAALAAYEARDALRVPKWNTRFRRS